MEREQVPAVMPSCFETCSINLLEASDDVKQPKPLHTIAETIEAFRTAVDFRFVRWLNAHVDVFASHRAKFGYVWA